MAHRNTILAQILKIVPRPLQNNTIQVTLFAKRHAGYSLCR